LAAAGGDGIRLSDHIPGNSGRNGQSESQQEDDRPRTDASPQFSPFHETLAPLNTCSCGKQTPSAGQNPLLRAAVHPPWVRRIIIMVSLFVKLFLPSGTRRPRTFRVSAFIPAGEMACPRG